MTRPCSGIYFYTRGARCLCHIVVVHEQWKRLPRAGVDAGAGEGLVEKGVITSGADAGGAGGRVRAAAGEEARCSLRKAERLATEKRGLGYDCDATVEDDAEREGASGSAGRPWVEMGGGHLLVICIGEHELIVFASGKFDA